MITAKEAREIIPELPTNSRLICEIPNFSNYTMYAIDKTGIVYNCKAHNFTNNKFKPWKALKTKFNKRLGYYYIIIKRDGVSKSPTIHRLLAQLFIPNPENYPCINHKDGNKMNNSLDNLEWCTYKHNAAHCIENGLRNTAKGERIPNSFLKEQDIHDIFLLKKKGLLNREISFIYNIDISAISRILNKKSWAHVTT